MSNKYQMEVRTVKKYRANKFFAVLLSMMVIIALAACGGTPAVSQAESSAPAGSAQGVLESGAASAPESAPTAEKTMIRFSFDQGVGEPTQKMVDKYNESQDKIIVETVILPQDANAVHDDFVNKLASEDTSVDVMALDVVYVAEFAAADWLEDLGQYFDAATQGQYLTGTIEGATYQGKLVAFPWFTNASVLFYRQDVIDHLGVDVPTTYKGWEDLAAKAKGVEGVEYLASFQASKSEALVCNWVEYLWNHGGDVLDASGKPVINSPNNIAATNTMLNWAKTYAPQGVTTYSEPESEQVFLDGKSLVLRDWSGFWSVAQRDGSKIAGKINATVLPIGEGGTDPHSCMGGLDLVVNKYVDDAHKAAAVEFLRYMSSYDTQKEFTLVAAQPPVLKAIYEDADVLAAIPFYKDFYGVIQGGKTRPMFPQYAKMSDAIQRHVHDALSGNVEVEAALNALQVEVEALG